MFEDRLPFEKITHLFAFSKACHIKVIYCLSVCQSLYQTSISQISHLDPSLFYSVSQKAQPWTQLHSVCSPTASRLPDTRPGTHALQGKGVSVAITLVPYSPFAFIWKKEKVFFKTSVLILWLFFCFTSSMHFVIKRKKLFSKY